MSHQTELRQCKTCIVAPPSILKIVLGPDYRSIRTKKDQDEKNDYEYGNISI